MHYQGPKGPAKARLLCRIVNGKGLAYVLAAPADRYRSEQTRMLKVAQSIVFFAPKSSGGGSGGDSAGDVTPAQIAAAARQIRWVKWTDPREGAFSLSVPQGWSVVGGEYRDPNNANVAFPFYLMESDAKDITLVFGSPTYISFTPPSQMSAQMGWQEGTHGVLHFMHASEFNKFYLNQMLSKVVSDLTPGKDKELVNKTTGDNQTQTTLSVGLTDFTGKDAKTGKPIGGIIMSRTTQMASQTMNGVSATWFADPTIQATRTGDSHDAARVQTALAVFGHVQQSYRENPQWTARYIEAWDAAQKKTHEQIMGDIAAAGERSKQIAANSDAQRNAIMGSYENHRAAVDNSNRGFINYLGNRTDVTDGTGHTANVASGYSHYYKGQDGTVVGTNSAYKPRRRPDTHDGALTAA